MQIKSRTELKTVYDITNDGLIADELGELRAHIKELQDAQRGLEDILKAGGVTEAVGTKYRVAITYGAERKTVAWKTIAAKLNPSRQLVAGNTSTTVYDRVTVSAHKK